MEAYAQALNYAIPIFLGMIAMEAIAAYKMKVKVNRVADTISSLSSGITNVVKDVLGLTFVIVSYAWLVDRIGLIDIKATWLVVVLAFLVKDLAGYWMHRFEHEINFLWNRHIIHHSSEEFNLSCALRQSVSEVFSFFAILLLPAALLGIPAEVIAIIAPIHLFGQFWYHTRLIGKMGWLESFLVTPSHHRVHHAMNPEYIDKNYGQILIIWDRMFGTFQAELDDVKPVYGVKRQVGTWNPFIINFQHFWLMLTDAIRTKSWKDKVRLWFMPTGWRPEDVKKHYPVRQVEDLDLHRKYETHPSPTLITWTWVQLGTTLILMFYLFNQIARIGFPGILIYGLFLFVSVFSYTTLLDKSRFSIHTEMIRVSLGMGLIAWQGGDWFGLSAYFPFGIYLLSGYFVLSAFVVARFVKKEVRMQTVIQEYSHR